VEGCFEPGTAMRLLVGVCAPMSLRRDSFSCIYSAVAIPISSPCAGLCLRQGRAQAIYFKFI